MSTATIFAVTCWLGLSVASCGNSDRTRIAIGGGNQSEPSSTCPVGTTGARVSMFNEEGGVVINLRAYGDIRDLQRRARDAAAMYGPGARRGRGHDGIHGRGGQHGLALDRIGVPVFAEATDTADGARILVKPRAPSDLEAMRAALSKRESSVRIGDCH